MVSGFSVCLVWKDFLPSFILYFCEATGCYKEHSALFTACPADKPQPWHHLWATRTHLNPSVGDHVCNGLFCLGDSHAAMTTAQTTPASLRSFYFWNFWGFTWVVTTVLWGLVSLDLCFKTVWFQLQRIPLSCCSKAAKRFSVFTESAVVKVTISSRVMVHTYLFFSREKRELLVHLAFRVPREAQ